MADLQECQARLLASVSLAVEQASSEVISIRSADTGNSEYSLFNQLIPFFEIGTQDRYTVRYRITQPR